METGTAISRTVAPPLSDRSYWRRLLAVAHPDRNGGDPELFVFLTALREHVEECVPERLSRCRDDIVTPAPSEATDRLRPERIPYDAALGYVDEFVTLTMRAISVGQHAEEPYRSILALLIDCPADDHGRAAAKQERGASYKQLALIGHRVGMSKAQRARWYELARCIPLSEKHASHIIGGLGERKVA